MPKQKQSGDLLSRTCNSRQCNSSSSCYPCDTYVNICTGVTSFVEPVAVKLPTGIATPPPTPTATVPTAPVPTRPLALRLLSVTRETVPTEPVAPTPVARTRVTDASSPVGT